MPTLPITSVDPVDSDADLADNSDATAVRISSSGDAEWFINLDATLAGATTVTITARFDVIASSGPFVARIRLQDPDFTVYAEGTLTLPDGLSTVTQALTDAFFTSPPAGWLVGGATDLASFIAGIGATPVLYVAGYDGVPYEVDLTAAAVSYAVASGVQPRRIFQRSR